jgi:hypothetical protein
MSMQASVSVLRQQLEHLFPGKWLSGKERSSLITTGFSAIDNSIAAGIARRRITEWIGPLSSGKTSILRKAITNWCAAGLNVAYVDAQGRLLAADWAFVDNGKGKFWIARPAEKSKAPDKTVVPLVSKRSLYLQEALWGADQFIRSRAFDVVVLDLGSLDPGDRKLPESGRKFSAGRSSGAMPASPIPSRVYARLQRCLDKSKTALIVVRDTQAQPSGWGCQTRFTFDWGTSIACEAGLAGVAMITPKVKLNVSRDGLSQLVEVELGSSVQNRLFTHPKISDRRTAKKG